MALHEGPQPCPTPPCTHLEPLPIHPSLKGQQSPPEPSPPHSPNPAASAAPTIAFWWTKFRSAIDQDGMNWYLTEENCSQRKEHNLKNSTKRTLTGSFSSVFYKPLSTLQGHHGPNCTPEQARSKVSLHLKNEVILWAIPCENWSSPQSLHN